MTLGRTLHRLRIERGWSQQTLAKRAQTSDATVCRLERGAQDPGLSLLRRLARALRLSLRDLVDPQPAPPRMPVEEARVRLAQLDAAEATLYRDLTAFARSKHHRPISARIFARQAKALGTLEAAIHHRATASAQSSTEADREQALAARGDRIDLKRRQVVLRLVAAGGLFSHPAVRRCYTDARRTRDVAFLAALAAAVAIPPPHTTDEHGAAVTNLDAARLD